jgi:hypothetical protein
MAAKKPTDKRTHKKVKDKKSNSKKKVTRGKRSASGMGGNSGTDAD